MAGHRLLEVAALVDHFLNESSLKDEREAGEPRGGAEAVGRRLRGEYVHIADCGDRNHAPHNEAADHDRVGRGNVQNILHREAIHFLREDNC